MTELELSPPEDKYFNVRAEFPKMEFKPIKIQLPKRRPISLKIKMCIDILFDRTYKR